MLRTLFVLAILVPGLFAAVASRFLALVVYVWFAIFRPQDWMWIDIGSLRLSLVLGVLVGVPRPWMASLRNPLRSLDLGEAPWPNVTHPLSIGCVLLMAMALVAQINAIDSATGWLWIDYLWRVLLISLFAVGLITTTKRLTLVLAIAAGSVGFHSGIAGVMALVSGGARYNNGIGGTFSDNNAYALAIVMTIYLAVAAIQNSSERWIRWGMAVTLPGSLITLVCTYSRGGFLAMAASGFVFLILQRRRAMWFSLLAPFVLVGVLFIPKDYTERLQTIKTYEEIGEDSALSRIHFWNVAIRMVGEHPLGIGLKNYESAYDRFDFSSGRYGHNRAVHSSYFQVLAELGYFGLFLFLAMFAGSFWIAFRVRRLVKQGKLPESDRHFFFTTSNALIASMAGFLVGGTFLSMAINDLTWLIFAVVAALDRLSRQAVLAAASAPSAVATPERRLMHEFKGGRAGPVLRPLPVSD
jgi:probable O-glycosylation ligase (exosortase A-associated)